MVYLIVYLAISISILLLVKTLIKRIINAFGRNKTPPMTEETEDTENENAAIIAADILENMDKQIDGYYQLLRLLDTAYTKETDEKKKAVILSKQIATLEKLNKTIERREKLE